jgi:uroporphyrinogen decarboxylase
MDMITSATIRYLNAQVKAGANIIQVFDSWAGVLTNAQYNTFAIPYLTRICEEVKGAPITIFAKGAFFAQHELSALPCQTLGLDWNMDAKSWRTSAPDKTLQGNLDPCVLYSDLDTIKKETIRMLDEFGSQKYIANLGHGVYPDTNFKHVQYFIDTVKNYIPKKHINYEIYFVFPICTYHNQWHCPK